MRKLDIKAKGIMSILLALLFIVPSVTAFNAGVETSTSKAQDLENENFETTELEELSEFYKEIDNAIAPGSDPNIRELAGIINDGKAISPVSEREVIFPGADVPQIKGGLPLSTEDPATTDNIVTDPEPNSDTESSSGTRSEARQENYDLEMRTIEYGEQNTGWTEQTDLDPADAPAGHESYWWEGNQGYIGSFFVGDATTITATVRNNGAVAVTNVLVNFTIYDYTSLVWDGITKWGLKVPQTKTIASLGPQQEQSVSISWTPQFASEYGIIAEVESSDSEDPDYENNALGWRNRVSIWQDDVESGQGSWTHAALQGGDNWHISSTIPNQNGMHTSMDAWYHGNPDSASSTYPLDSYPANDIVTLTSPTINMGDIINRKDDEGAVYLDYFACFASLLTGESEVNDNVNPNNAEMGDCDILWFDEVSEDGSTWEPINLGFYTGGISGNRYMWTTFGGGMLYFNTPTWTTEWFPAPGYATSDGTNLYYNYGAPLNFNVTDSWNNIRFRARFETDGDANNELGFSLDDFIVWGVQDWTVPMDVDITEFSVPSVSGIPIVHPNEAATFTTKIENKKGAAAKTFNVVLKIKNMGTGDEWQESTKSVSLAKDEEKSQQWSWTPSEDGDYRLKIIAGDPADDYFWPDNEEYRLVRVRESTDEILLVDDDNSDYTRDENVFFAREVVGKMCDALEDVEVQYDVYTVGSNETGPTKAVMEQYTTVIWMTGLDNQHSNHAWRDNYQAHPTQDVWDTSLKSDDETQLEMYLNLNDHNLWLISPSFIYDEYGVTQKTTGTSDFARQYLHVWACEGNVTQEDSGGVIIVRGTPDPLDGIPETLTEDKDGTVSFTTYDTEPPSRFSDIGATIEAVPTEDATDEIFYQNPEHTAYNGVSYSGDSANRYKSVYLAFNFYLIKEPLDRAELVDKVLTFFGLMGGVELEMLDTASTKNIDPSSEVSFQFKVINVGKKTDTMTIDADIYSSTTASKNDWPVYKIEINGQVKNTIDVPGTSSNKNYVDDIYLIITAPDWDKAAAKWDTKYTFVVTAESEKTGNTSYATMHTILNLYSNITVSYSQQFKEIDIDDSWDCVITLKNNTNGDANYEVAMKIDGEGKELATFTENNQKTVTVILSPNTARQVIVKIKSGDNELAGYHNITIEIKGTTTQIVHALDTIATKVDQFYEVAINSTDETRVVVDPNDIVGDTITETFTINIYNYGNGYDYVQFIIESHDQNEIEQAWLEDIEIDFDGYELVTEYDDSEEVLRTTKTVAVQPYDVSNEPEYGEEEVTITINVNNTVEHGEYWFNVIVESIVGLNDEEDPENNNLTIMLKVIKPDLVFSPQDLNDTTYDNYPDRVIDNYRFIDDVYGETISWDDFDEVYLVTLDHRTDRDESKGTYGSMITLSFEIVINNIGDSPANLEAVPQTIVINVSHEEEDEFGTFNMVDDGTLYPISPTEVVIKPGGNATIVFDILDIEWMNPKQDTEVIYTFTVTLDSKNFVMEQDETNNGDIFELSVLHLKKPKKSTSGSPGFELVVLLAAVIVVALAGLERKRLTKRRK